MFNTIKNMIKNYLRNFYYLLYSQINHSNTVMLFWWNGKENIGDAINYDIASFLGNEKKVKWVPSNYRGDHVLCIGSVLQLANEYSIVWGSGFISSDEVLKVKPKKVLAVRGPKTRNKLLDLGIDCPEVYGDPALLLPKIYNIEIEKKYKLGIVPHFVDKNCEFVRSLKDKGVLLIDPETTSLANFVDNIKSCNVILSSSLHGIIISDAYGVPALRVKFSNQIKGGDFKFEDYFLSVNREIQLPVLIDSKTTIDELLKLNYEYQLNIDTIALEKCCPF